LVKIGLKNKIILASSSPRRKLLLRSLLNNFGLKFDIIPANIAEYIPKKISNFGDFASNLAELKALEVATRKDGLILAADTIVVLKGEILDKPKTEKDAKIILKKLSNNTHSVYTGFVIFNSFLDLIYKSYERTYVTFRKIENHELNFYIKTGSCYDKAGGYGIQDDLGATFVKKISGDYYNVVGLPVYRIYEGLKKFIKLI
jgi:septum formation protein